MKRVWTTIAIVALCLAPLGADVTITQKISIEGPMAAAMGGEEPKIVLRVKGNKSRSDADLMGTVIASITDLDKKQVIILNGSDKTAQVISMTEPAAKPDSAIQPPDVDVQFKATGNKRTLEAGSCDDHSFTVSLDMAQFGAGGQMPPEAVEMMKGVKIIANGVSCIAKEGKGVAEFSAFQKAAIKSGLMSAVMGQMPGGGVSGGGMDKLMSAVSAAPGLPYITEITMTFEGTGPMVDMMKQMGAMKIVQQITAVSTDAISDDLFTVPSDYKITEKK